MHYYNDKRGLLNYDPWRQQLAGDGDCWNRYGNRALQQVPTAYLPDAASISIGSIGTLPSCTSKLEKLWLWCFCADRRVSIFMITGTVH